MSGKKTYTKVVAGDEKTPDHSHSWMRAYLWENEDDALTKPSN